MYESESEVKQIVRKLKELHSNLYSLPIEDFTEFVRMRSNLLAEGVLITNEMLELPEDQLVELVKRQLEIHGKERSVEEDSKILERLTNVDLERFDEDRSRMRKSLFGSSVHVNITQSGKSFNVSLGTTMKSIKVNVPADWEVTLTQGLLLKLYDQTFKDTLPHVDINDIGSIISVLALRYQDYSTLRKLLDVDYESSRPDKAELDDTELVRKLKKLGLTLQAIFVLTKLIDLYRLNKISMNGLLKMISRTGRTRRRLLVIVSSMI